MTPPMRLALLSSCPCSSSAGLQCFLILVSVCVGFAAAKFELLEALVESAIALADIDRSFQVCDRPRMAQDGLVLFFSSRLFPLISSFLAFKAYRGFPLVWVSRRKENRVFVFACECVYFVFCIFPAICRGAGKSTLTTRSRSGG